MYMIYLATMFHCTNVIMAGMLTELETVEVLNDPVPDPVFCDSWLSAEEDT